MSDNIKSIMGNWSNRESAMEVYNNMIKNTNQVGKQKETISKKRQRTIVSDADPLVNDYIKPKNDTIQISRESRETSDRSNNGTGKGMGDKKSVKTAPQKKESAQKKSLSQVKAEQGRDMVNVSGTGAPKDRTRKTKVKKNRDLQTRLVDDSEPETEERETEAADHGFLKKLYESGGVGATGAAAGAAGEDELGKIFGAGGDRTQMDPETEKYLRMGQAGGPGGPGGPGGGNPAVGGAGSKTEAATVFQQSQQDAQNAASILMELAAQRMKWQMEIWKIIQELQTSIMEIVQSVLINRAAAMDKIHNGWTSVIRGGSSS